MATVSGALRFSMLFARYRHLFAALIAVLTLFFAWQIRHLEVFTQFLDLLPREHPYTKTYEAYRDVYGSANTVVIEVLALEGDIYRPEVLAAVDQATSLLDSSVVDAAVMARPVRSFVEPRSAVQRVVHELALALERTFGDAAHFPAETGVDHNLISSLTHRTARDQRIEADGTLRSPMLVPALPESPEERSALRERVRRNPSVFGVLVSTDERAALVRASFTESRLDYAALFRHVQELRRTVESRFPVRVFASGQPLLFGWIFAFASEILLVFALTLLVSVALLWAYFRRLYAVFLPLSGAAVNVIWGLGFAGWQGFNLDPLVLVVPMLITARAISHSVQFVERFAEEYEELGDKEQACIRSMAELLLPGTLAILTDCVGLLTVALATIPLIHNLGVLCAFWAASIAVTEMLLNRLLLLYLPPPRERRRHVPRIVDSALRGAASLVGSRRGAGSVAAGFALFAFGALLLARGVEVGDSRSATPILYADSPYNLDAAEIEERFGVIDDLLIVAHGDRPGRVYQPDALELIEELQAVMEADPNVGGSISFLDLLKQTSQTFHNGDPRWGLRMQTALEVTAYAFLLETSVPAPGILDPYRAIDQRSLAVRIFYGNHRADSVRGALARLEEFAASERLDGSLAVRLRVPEPSGLRNWLPGLDWLLGPQAPLLDVTAYDSEGNLRSLAVETGLDEPSADGMRVLSRWVDAEHDRSAELRRASWLDRAGLWVREPGGEFEYRWSDAWLPDGVELRRAGGSIGVTGAAHAEIAASHRAGLVVAFAATLAIILLSYRSLAVACLLGVSLGVAALAALAAQSLLGIAIDTNTLPIQAIGIGIGIDYAVYLVDRILRERQRGLGRAAAVERAVRTTGLAIAFTASTLVAGIVFWVPVSSLRFNAEMSLLLVILMTVNALGAVLLVPALVRLLPTRLAGPFGEARATGAA